MISMNLTTRAFIGAGVAGLALSLAATCGAATEVTELMFSGVIAMVGVASAAQWVGYRANDRRVYRPVYVRTTTVHRRLRSDDR